MSIESNVTIQSSPQEMLPNITDVQNNKISEDTSIERLQPIAIEGNTENNIASRRNKLWGRATHKFPDQTLTRKTMLPNRRLSQSQSSQHFMKPVIKFTGAVPKFAEGLLPKFQALLKEDINYFEKYDNAPPKIDPKKFNYATGECLEPKNKSLFDYDKCCWRKAMAGNLKLEKQFIKNVYGKTVQAKQDTKGDGRFWVDLHGNRVYDYSELYK